MSTSQILGLLNLSRHCMYSKELKGENIHLINFMHLGSERLCYSLVYKNLADKDLN